MEALVKRIVRREDLSIIVDNIGVDNGFSAVYTTNAAMHTGFVQVGLKPGHRIGSYEYIREIKERSWPRRCPRSRHSSRQAAWWTPWCSMGAPAPIDMQIAGSNLEADNRVAQEHCRQAARFARRLPTCSCRRISITPRCGSMWTVCTPPKLGLTEREVLTNVITSLTSNQMIAPNLWIDPAQRQQLLSDGAISGAQIHSMQDLRSIPLHAEDAGAPTRLDMIANIERIQAPTEVDHYQIRRKLDVYVRPATEDLGAAADYVRRRDCPAGDSRERQA